MSVSMTSPDLAAIAELTGTGYPRRTADGVWQVDAASGAASFLAVEVGKLLYPVGCIYTSVNSTNPATSLGFGTWSAFGAGRVPVGFDTSDTDFDTDEETGGAKTVATNVTVATQPTFSADSHTHTLAGAGYARLTSSSTNIYMARVSASAWTATFTDTSVVGAADSTGGLATGVGLGGTTDAPSVTTTTRTADVALTNNATSVQQKYIVVRMWKRTA